MFKTFKLNNCELSWRQIESSNSKLMNKPSVTPPLVLTRLTAGVNWPSKHENWKWLNLIILEPNKRASV